jgi:DNA modification methylase
MLEGGKRSILDWLYRFKNFYLDQLIWNKGTAAPTPPQTITPKHEMIFIFSKEEEPNKRIKTMQEQHFFSVIEIDRNSHNEFAESHRATFPVSLAINIIETFSEKNSTIYEPFCGSGSTLIACEKTNRKCFMMELDPHYCDVIVARWEKYTGKKAELINA